MVDPPALMFFGAPPPARYTRAAVIRALQRPGWYVQLMSRGALARKGRPGSVMRATLLRCGQGARNEVCVPPGGARGVPQRLAPLMAMAMARVFVRRGRRHEVP